MTAAERLEKEIERLGRCHAEEKALSEGARLVFGIDEAGRGPLCGPVVAACCLLSPGIDAVAGKEAGVPGSDQGFTGGSSSGTISSGDSAVHSPAGGYPGILYLNDSKKLSDKKRRAVYSEIKDRAFAYGLGYADEKRIDEINILNATFEAMKEAFNNCISMYRDKKDRAAPGSGPEVLPDEPGRIHGSGGLVVLVDGNRTVPGIMYRQKAVVGGDAKCPSISAASILAKVTRDDIMLGYDELYPEYGFRSNKGYGTKEHIEAIRKYGILDIHRRSFLRKL